MSKKDKRPPLALPKTTDPDVTTVMILWRLGLKPVNFPDNKGCWHPEPIKM